MQITELLRVLRTRWRTIAVVVALAMVAAWALLPSKVGPHGAQMSAQATSTLVLQNDDSVGANKQPGAKELNTLGVIASEGEVPAEVATKLNTSIQALRARVKITSSATTNSLSIVAVDRTRQGAAATADTYSETLVTVLTSQVRAAQAESRAAATLQVRQLESANAKLAPGVTTDPSAKAELDAGVRQLNTLRSKLTDLNAQPPANPGLRSIGAATVRPLSTAKLTDRLLRLPIRLALGGILGFVGALAVFVLLDRFDVRLRTRQAVELAYGLPVLAEVPVRRGKRTGGLVLASDPGDTASVESYRILRTSLLSFGPARADLPRHDPARSCLIVVTSADSAEGKTSTAANLAASFAEAGRETLVVGLDLRHDDLKTVIPSAPGDEEVHLPTGRGTNVVRVSVRNTKIRGLRLVSVLPPLAPPPVVLTTVAAWLRQLHSEVDAIVVDTPALLACNDTSEVIPFADTVLVASRSGRSTAEAAERATEVLERIHAPTCGVVLVAAVVRSSLRNVAAYKISGPAFFDDRASGDVRPVRNLGLAPVPVAPSPPVLVADDPDGAEQLASTADAPAARQESPPTPVIAVPRAPSSSPEPAPAPAMPPTDAPWCPVPVPAVGSPPSVRRTLNRALERIASRRHQRL